VGSIALAVALLLVACGGGESERSAVARLRTSPETPTPAASDAPAGTETRTKGTATPIITAGPTKTTTTAGPLLGTRVNPIPTGEAVRVGDWEVTVLSAIPDATEAVLDENDFNDPPQTGNQYYMVEVTATYVGNESELLTAGLSFSAVGESSVAYDYSATCWVIPDPVDDYAEVFPGGTVRGNLCWEVSASDADSLVLIVDPVFSFDDERSYMEIPAEGAGLDPAPPSAPGIDINTPFGIGDTVPVGDWELTALSVTPDATDAVMEENQFNEPPQPGYQFYIVEISATYVGDQSEALALGPSMSAVGGRAVAYGYNATCGVIPNAVDDFTELFPGGTVQGNLCWEVAATDIDSMVLIVDPIFSFDEERYYIDLG
jgi:hypothetical protein